jgi:hypothetical protein
MKSKLSAAVAAFSIIAAYAALAGSTAARADLVTFTLTNVEFSGGGSASGKFIYDSSLVQITSVDITTTTAGAFPGQSYTNASLAFIVHLTTPDQSRFDFVNTNNFNLFLDVLAFPPSISTSSTIVPSSSFEFQTNPPPPHLLARIMQPMLADVV